MVDFLQKNTGKPGVSLDEAVTEAVCFGWIDGILKRIDDERYILRFTPRKKGSSWANPNIKRAKKHWEAFAPSHRKETLSYLNPLKTKGSLMRNIEKVLKSLHGAGT